MVNSQFVLGRDLFMPDFGLPKIAALLCRVVFLQRDPALLFLPQRLTASDESAVALLDIGPCFSGLTTGLSI